MAATIDPKRRDPRDERETPGNGRSEGERRTREGPQVSKRPPGRLPKR